MVWTCQGVAYIGTWFGFPRCVRGARLIYQWRAEVRDLMERAEALRALGRWQEALALLRRVLASDPTSSRAHWNDRMNIFATLLQIMSRPIL